MEAGADKSLMFMAVERPKCIGCRLDFLPAKVFVDKGHVLIGKAVRMSEDCEPETDIQATAEETGEV